MQWCQLPAYKGWVSEDPKTKFNKMTEPTKYDVHTEGSIVFELNIEEGEVVVHGGEKCRLSSFI